MVGNAAIMKCLLPSFVTDFIHVLSWVVVENEESNEIPIASGNNWGKKLKTKKLMKWEKFLNFPL